MEHKHREGQQGEKDDNEIVFKIQHGNREAFEEMVNRYYRDIFAFVRSLTGDYHIAEDITQEIFVKVYTRIHTYTQGNFRAWIFRIARNTVNDHWRKKKTERVQVPLNGHTVNEPDERWDPHRSLEFYELQDELEKALSSLSPGLREAFVMKHIMGMSYAEMKRITGWPVALLKVRVHRARSKILKVIRAKAAG